MVRRCRLRQKPRPAAWLVCGPLEEEEEVIVHGELCMADDTGGIAITVGHLATTRGRPNEDEAADLFGMADCQGLCDTAADHSEVRNEQ